MSKQLLEFSIIITTYERPMQLGNCLESLMRLDYPHERFEVIVVDDGSQIPIDSVVMSFRKRLNIMFLKQAHMGPAKARNVGVAQARGHFLVFTDDDCTPASNWLQTLAARFATAPNHMIGGRTINALRDNPYSAFSQLLIEVVYAHYNADANEARFFACNNLALASRHFRTLGGFDDRFSTAEDRDLCDRWLDHGYRMTYASEAIVYHAHELTLRSFWWQHFNYGRGAFRFHEKRTQRGAGPFRPDLQFYLKLLRSPFAQAQVPRTFVLVVLLLVQQAANATGFFWEKRKSSQDIGV
jgi:GT2 family glycosyltransferase